MILLGKYKPLIVGEREHHFQEYKGRRKIKKKQKENRVFSETSQFIQSHIYRNTGFLFRSQKILSTQKYSMCECD
jgi:hypothetical protein